MQIFLNGEIFHHHSQLSISDLLLQLELTGKRLAVEVNQQIVPRSQHAEYLLCESDKVEIIQAVGGG